MFKKNLKIKEDDIAGKAASDKSANENLASQNTYECESSDDADSFVAAQTFEGQKDGYVFKLGSLGLGYYLDKCQNGSEGSRQASIPIRKSRENSTRDRKVSFSPELEQCAELCDLDRELDQHAAAHDREKKKAWFSQMKIEFAEVTDKELERLWKLGKKKRKKKIDYMRSRLEQKQKQNLDSIDKGVNEPSAGATISHVDSERSPDLTAAAHVYDRGYEKWDNFKEEDSDSGDEEVGEVENPDSDENNQESSDWTNSLENSIIFDLDD